MPAPNEPRRCPNCDTEVALVDTICWRCYHRLPPPPPPAAVRRRRHLRVPVPSAVAGLLIAGLGGYLWYVRSSPTAALTAFLRAQSSGNVKAMYELLSARSRNLLDPETLAKPAHAPAAPQGFVVRSVQRDDWGALITLAVPSISGGAEGPAVWRVHMVREAGRWRVDMVGTVEAEAGGDRGAARRSLLRAWRESARGG